MVKIKDRNSNFELMRIISMLFIVLWHVIMHGNMINNCTNDSIRIVLEFIQYIIIIHVNSFVLLSGYFQSKNSFRLSKFFSIIFKVIFYSSLILIFATKFNILEEFSMGLFVNNLLPSSVSNYWFIKMYVVVYLLSDIINIFINSLSREKYKKVLISLFILFSVLSFITGGRFFENTGYNFYNFVFLYMIGGYFRRYPIKETYHFRNMSKNGYRFLLIFIFFLMSFLSFSLFQFADKVSGYNLFTEISNRIFYSKISYSTPIVMIQTMCYFLFFETFTFKSKVVNYISSCTLGIYLFHDNFYVRSVIYKLFKIDNGPFVNYNMIIRMILVVIIIFAIGLIIESVIKLIIKIISKSKIINKFIYGIKNYINSFNYKIRW